MKTFRTLFVVAALGGGVLAPVAHADEIFVVTPSGQAEAIFNDDMPQASDKIVDQCLAVGWNIVSSATNAVVCESPMNVGESILGQLLVGNSYSTPVKRYFRFNISGIQGRARVVASGWLETQMAFGQIRREEFSGANFHNSAMNFLVASGGLLPPGTTFPNHVQMGVEIEMSRPTDQGVAITKVYEGSAAAAAGLQIGDSIYRVAGERIKDEADWSDGAAKAAREPTYVVEIYRGGERQKITLERRFRPPAGELPPLQIVAASGPAVASPSAPLSLADELAKFAKLRDEGIITDTEFETQKARLLAE